MGFAAGDRIGPYEILGPLGAGGMGEVYRARDSRLDREVAIKVLPPAFAADPERLRRFDREARAAGRLNHPNLLTVHDVGNHEGSPYLVTELLEGESLRGRIARGPLPIDDAVGLAAQILRGIEAAHGRGIVHRDLKPDNLHVTPDGRVKILDFGLAKVVLPREAGSGITRQPTRGPATGVGAVLGTAGYMSPEQVRGMPAGPASDVFSFGAILYEMLSGRGAFGRDTEAETMAAILRDDPESLATLRPDAPGHLVDLVERCLRRDPAARPATPGEALALLEGLHPSRFEAGAAVPWYRARGTWAWVLLVAVVAVGAVLQWAGRSGRFGTPRPLRLTQITVAEEVEDFPAWSPDGRRIAYTCEKEGMRQICIRDLATGRESPAAPNAYDAIQPAWAPDGSTLLFVRARQEGKRLEPGDIFAQYTGGDVWVRDLREGSERRLVENAFSPAFSPDGRRVALDAAWLGPSRIWLVDREGRNPIQLTSDASEAVTHLRPRWSPDGRRIVFQRLERTRFDIQVVDAATRAVMSVTDDLFRDLAPVWSPAGDAVYFSSDRGGGLNVWRIPVSPRGDPAGRAEQLTTGAGQDVNVSVSTEGERVVFSTLRQNADLWKLPLDPRTGRSAGPPVEVLGTTREESRAAWSPDGRRIAFNSDRTGEMNLWVHDTRDGTTRQLTRGPGGDYQPRWSPDGSRLVYFSSRSGNADIWILDIGTGGSRRLTRTPATEINPFFSPDGRHVAYQSDAEGRLEVWVVDAQGESPRRLTSIGVTGHFLRWSRDGRWVYFRSPGGGASRTMRVPSGGGEPEPMPEVAGGSHISLSPSEESILDVVGHKALWLSPLAAGAPERIFEFEDPAIRIDYPDWSPDGRWVVFDRFRPGGGDIWLLEGLR